MSRVLCIAKEDAYPRGLRADSGSWCASERRVVSPPLLADPPVCLRPGAGALATVSLVQHRGNQRYLALKRMDKKKILKMKQLEHIHNEKSLLEEVDHPFIVGL